MKSLVLLSFSLAFLTQGFADDIAEPSNQVSIEEHDGSQMMANDSLAAEPSEQVSAEKHDGNQVIANDSLAAEPSEQVSAEKHDGSQMMANDSLAAEPNKQAENKGHNSTLSDEEKPYAPMQPEDSSPEWCLSPYHEIHASIRHNEARGIGYKDGYSTLEFFGIYDGWGSGFMPFADVRGHIFNNGYLAGNVGIGERTLFTSINHTFGSYLYYDVRRVGHGLTVNQLSPGIELVGELMEYRINGYFPLGKQKGHQYGFEFDKFKGHSIILKANQQQAMMGFDAEVGAHIPQNTTYDVYLAAGPYYFRSSNAHSWGGKARILGRYKEYVTLEAAYSYDNLFRSVVQGSIAFTLPFGSKLQRCGKCCPQTDNLLLSRAAFAPSRFEIPVVKKVRRHEKAIDPATGQPWTVWFVNNTSHSDGTFESPFPTLVQAQNASSPNDMIYVFPGDGTTKGMDAGITLKDGQNFFGSGVKQHFATTHGTMAIPAMSASYPSIINGTGSVVLIGNDNIVSGFNIPNVITNFSGISSSSNTINATIANNIITASNFNSISGIAVQGFGKVNIYNNQISGTFLAIQNGIFLQANGGLMKGKIKNNIITGPSVNGIVFNDGQEEYNFTIEGNTINSNSNIFVSMPGNSMVRIIRNTLLQNSQSGIFISDSAISTSSGSVTIDKNVITITGSTPNAVGIQVVGGLLGGHLNAVITNNEVNSIVPTPGAGFHGIDISAGSPITICLSLNNNTVAVPNAAAAFFFRGAPGTVNIDSIEGNVGGPVASTGNVNFVAPGTCGN